MNSKDSKDRAYFSTLPEDERELAWFALRTLFSGECGMKIERNPDYMLPLTEEQRQLVLLALAHLSVERPGWRPVLKEIATPIDGLNPCARFESDAGHDESLFDTFVRIGAGLDEGNAPEK